MVVTTFSPSPSPLVSLLSHEKNINIDNIKIANKNRFIIIPPQKFLHSLKRNDFAGFPARLVFSPVQYT